MPQTRSQQAAEEQVAEQPVDTVEQEQLKKLGARILKIQKSGLKKYWRCCLSRKKS